MYAQSKCCVVEAGMNNCCDVHDYKYQFVYSLKNVSLQLCACSKVNTCDCQCMDLHVL